MARLDRLAPRAGATSSGRAKASWAIRVVALAAGLAFLGEIALGAGIALTDSAGAVGVQPGARANAAAPAHGWVSAWLPYWNQPAALGSTLAGAGVIGTAHPFWYAITGVGRIDDQTGAGDGGMVAALRARDIAVVPTVTETAGLRAFDRVLASPERRAAVVRALVAIASSSASYGGVDLDFEQFAVDSGHDAAAATAAAALYPKLVAQACAALHAIGRTCSVTVMPRTGPAHVYWRGRLATWVYDYSALAHAADRVEIMAYDEHAPKTPPGPIAPYAWVRAIIAYARATMPADRTILALPAYGYDWSPHHPGVAIAAREAPALAAGQGVAPDWDRAQQEDTFSYGPRAHRHTVWYEPTASSVARARLAATAGLAGVAIWAAGDEDPGLWAALSPLERSAIPDDRRRVRWGAWPGR